MSQSKRSLSNLPEYYDTLNSKQKQNWKRNTKRIERNETLKAKYPPFRSLSNTTIIHLHYLTPITVVKDLIVKAKETQLFTIDSESQVINKESKGALVQIDMVHSINYTTLILFETFHLPNPDSLLFTQMKKLCSIILNGSNEILSWGPLHKEVENFQNFELFDIGNVKKKTNLQNLFSEWHNEQAKKAHPGREKREKITRRTTNDIYDTPGDYVYPTQEEFTNIICKCGHHSHSDPNSTWSLQDAIGSVFEEFLNKEETINKWGCGLDIELGTWKKKLFSKFQYDPREEKEKRLLMIDYASGDCLAVTRLYFQINPLETTVNNIYVTPKLTNDKMELDAELSDVSEDELDQIWLPYFDKPSSSKNNEQNDLTIQVTTEEMNEMNVVEETSTEQQQLPQSNARSSKSERQWKKNLKLKWKQQNLPHFQTKIKRPIYYKYGYQKIRAQLADDKISTSHQLTISRKFNEVIIGFKSKQEYERAINIIKINYFSKNQYNERSG